MKKKELLPIIIKSLAIASIFILLNTIINYNNNVLSTKTIESSFNANCCIIEKICKIGNETINNNINIKYIATSNYTAAGIGFIIGLIINLVLKKKSKNKLYILSIFMAISGILILLHSTYLFTTPDTKNNYKCNELNYKVFPEYKNLANKTNKISIYHMYIMVPTYAIGLGANIIGNKKKKRK